MTAETLPHPATGKLWDVGEQILFLQEIAARLFEDGNWWGAFRVVSRIIHVSKKLPDDRNPLTRSAREFLGEEGMAALQARRHRPRAPRSPDAPAGPPPVPGPEPTPETAETAEPTAAEDTGLITKEEAHARFLEVLARMNRMRAEAEAPPISFAHLLQRYRDHDGGEFADAVEEVEDSLRAAPPPDG